MLRVTPKSSWSRLLFRGGKWLVIGELTFLGVSYLGWRQMNHNQDARYYLYKNHNWLLESYYQFGEKISSESNVREYDLSCWQRDGKT